MDDRSFDQLVKRLSEQRTRRTSLRALAGGTLAAVALAETSVTHARKRKKKCKAPRVKCGRKLCCAAGQRCVGGACVAPPTTATTSTSTTSATSSTTTSTTPQPSVCTPPCTEGLQCVNETCTCNETLCDALTNPNPGQQFCNCTETFGGQVLCIANQRCTGHVDCDAGGGCPSGFVCQVNGCGGEPTCVKTCV